jgi:SynChlorMet cassette radical SAM/SPASM protein ScmF
MAYFLKEKSNVSSISVSIDSVIPEEHDAFRGVKGAFNSVIRGLDFLVEAGYTNCQVIMSVHRDNLNQMEKIVQLAIEHKATSVKFNPIMPTGRGINMHQQGFALDFSELLDMAKTVNEVLRPSTSIHLLFDLPPALTPLEEIWRKKGSYCHCGVNGILGILGSGEIALCGIGNTNPELTYGLLGKDSIRDIWLNNPNIIKLRKELDDYLQYPGICGSCIHAKICRTGCVAHNYMNEGILVSPQRLCQEAYRKNLFPTSRMRNIKKLGN